MNRPSVHSLAHWMKDELVDVLGERHDRLDVGFLYQSRNLLEDGTTVLSVRRPTGAPHAVALCSAPAAPNAVRRAMSRARRAKRLLGRLARDHILEPLVEGSIRGLSYAVLPYCRELSRHPAMWWTQRTVLRSHLLGWLFRATERCWTEVSRATLSRCFVGPLEHMASLQAIGGSLRALAERALTRLSAGAWTPRHVLMHGDLWRGNILIGRPGGEMFGSSWRNRFVIIDWGGSEVYGHPIYDLIRLARSMRLSSSMLLHEVERHCRLLRCGIADAASHLVAALGHLGTNLEYFPVEAFTRLSESCVWTLERALGRERRLLAAAVGHERP